MKIIKIVSAFICILIIAKQSHPGCIGNFSFPGGVKTPKTVKYEHIEKFLLDKEKLTFICFKITKTDFHKWMENCQIDKQLEPIDEPIEVTHLVKEREESRFFKKKIYVGKGFSFIWDSEQYRGSIVYDTDTLKVYIESLQALKEKGKVL